MLVEHGDAVGRAADIAGGGLDPTGDQTEQRGLAGTIGAGDGDAFGTADVERQRAEQAAVTMSHHHVLEGDEFAAAGETGFGQIDRERRQHLDARAGLLKRIHAIAGEPIGDLALARGTVFGALLLGIEEHRAVGALGAPGAAGFVAASLLFFFHLDGAFGVAQRVRGPAQFGLGTGAGGIARFGECRPRAAEHRDADGGQFHDAVDTLQ